MRAWLIDWLAWLLGWAFGIGCLLCFLIIIAGQWIKEHRGVDLQDGGEMPQTEDTA